MTGAVTGLVLLGDKEFELFRSIIYKECGINLSDIKKALVQARLMKRLRSLALPSYEDYYSYLMDNYKLEIINLINCITTNKTDFFREDKHFKFMENAILPEIERKKNKKIRIWSAACSTGEEPYSIAITLLKYFQNKKMPDVKILATDIDTDVLNRGMTGIYKEELLSSVDKSLLKKYFLIGRDANKGKYMIKDFVKRLVSFRRLNLQSDTFPMKNQFDIIFCRNVLIYFDRPTQKVLFSKLYRHLNDDGYLLVGHSESITGVTNDFSGIGSSIYKKTLRVSSIEKEHVSINRKVVV